MLQEEINDFDRQFKPLFNDGTVSAAQLARWRSVRVQHSLLLQSTVLMEELLYASFELEARLFVRRAKWAQYYMTFFFPGEGLEHICNQIAWFTVSGDAGYGWLAHTKDAIQDNISAQQDVLCCESSMSRFRYAQNIEDEMKRTLDESLEYVYRLDYSQ